MYRDSRSTSSWHCADKQGLQEGSNNACKDGFLGRALRSTSHASYHLPICLATGIRSLEMPCKYETILQQFSRGCFPECLVPDLVSHRLYTYAKLIRFIWIFWGENQRKHANNQRVCEPDLLQDLKVMAIASQQGVSALSWPHKIAAKHKALFAQFWSQQQACSQDIRRKPCFAYWKSNCQATIATSSISAADKEYIKHICWSWPSHNNANHSWSRQLAMHFLQA